MSWLGERHLDVKRSHAWKAWALGVVCVLVCCASAAAQLDERAVLAGLGDDDYRVRQEATRQLLLDESLTADQLDALYVASETPEQRNRLLRVARHHMIRRLIEQNYGELRGSGSMGLSHHVVQVTGPDGQTQQTGVMVVMTLPGFPAYAMLDPGDVIVRFAGEDMPQRMSPTQFQLLIRDHKAGEVIEIVVMRNGKPMTLDFQMSQGQALSEVYDTSGITLNEPYLGLWTQERARIEGLLRVETEDESPSEAPITDDPGA